MKKLLIASILTIGCKQPRVPATYYVSPAGDASWSVCKSESTNCSLSTANANAGPGDVVLLRGGVYEINKNFYSAINPARSGAQGQVIEFKAYPGETPQIVSAKPTQDRTCVNLNNRSWIRIDGVSCQDFFRWVQIQNYAHHNEIKNSHFFSEDGEQGAMNNLIIGLVIAGICSGGSSYNCYSTHNWIHNNVFEKAHGYTSNPCLEGADLLRIGYPAGTSNDQGFNNFNTIENNVGRYAGHAILDQYGLYNVIKGNNFSNPPWWKFVGNPGQCPNPSDYENASYDGKYSHRVMQITRNHLDHDTYVLVEGNKLSEAGINPANDGAENLDIAAGSVIARYNDIFNSMGGGIMFKYAYSLKDKVYNNTIVHNGYGYPYFWTCTTPVCPTGGYAIQAYDSTKRTGSIAINNLMYDSARYHSEGNETGLKSGHDKPNLGYFTEGPNWYSKNGDPKLSEDFSLQAGSGAVDAGSHLTTAANAGTNSDSLIVVDSLFFQDGTWGSDLARGITFFPDSIAIGNVQNVVGIKLIDYRANTITLASTMTWKSGDKIWLASKSDGKITLFGNGPDFGAHEYDCNVTRIKKAEKTCCGQ